MFRGKRPMLALLVAALMWSFGPATAASALADTGEGVWTDPMFRGNPGRTGEAIGPGPLGEPVLKWRFETAAPVVVDAAISDGVLYAGSWDHYLYALDVRSGAERWRFLAGAGFFSSPAIAGDLVYAGGNDGVLYAVDVATGAERWRFTTEEPVWSSPVVVGGTVFVGSIDGGLYAIDAASGR